MRTCLIDVDPGIGRVQSAKYAKSCHLPICIPSSDVGGQVGNTHRQTLALGHPKCAGGPRGRGARDPCNRTAIRRPRADAHPRSRAATANFSGREPFRACSISYNLLLRLGSPFVRGFLRTAHSRHSPEFLRLSTQPPPPSFFHPRPSLYCRLGVSIASPRRPPARYGANGRRRSDCRRLVPLSRLGIYEAARPARHHLGLPSTRLPNDREPPSMTAPRIMTAASPDSHPTTTS